MKQTTDTKIEHTETPGSPGCVIHDLKTWPQYWNAINDGSKTFECRRNDRKFREGDVLRLWHYDPETRQENGACIEADVTYVMHGPSFGVEEGWCVMALKVRWSQAAIEKATGK